MAGYGTPSLIRFVYTFIPGKSADKARFVVDADVIKDSEKEKRGEKHPEISHFASEYDIKDFPDAQSALEKKSVVIENEFRYDQPYDIYSVTGYAPIIDSDGKYLGTLGVDMADSDVRAALVRARNISIGVGVGTKDVRKINAGSKKIER